MFQVSLSVVTFSPVCNFYIFFLFRIPLIVQFTSFLKHRRKRSDDFDDDFFSSDSGDSESSSTDGSVKHRGRHKNHNKPFCPSIDLDPEFYCSLIETLPMGCMQENILELWKFDMNLLDSMNKSDIIDLINSTKLSPWSGHEIDIEHLLGGIERDESGRIVSATSVVSHYMLYVNFSDSDSNKVGNLAGTEDGASESTMLWEDKFISLMGRLKKELEGEDEENITIFYSAGRR